MSASTIIPVGSIAMFAGDVTQSATAAALAAAGWAPCDGTSYSKTDYPDLFAAIGTAHGGSGDNFNVPQMNSRFVRGANGSTAVDPDAASRIAAAPGGAVGNAVGSLQNSATALPNSGWVLAEDGLHNHAYQHLNTEMHEVWSGSTDSMARWSTTVTVQAAGSHFHGMTGGDAATIPVNASMYFVIRTKSAAASGQTPAGAMICMGADISAGAPAGWLYCNGMAQAQSTANAALISAMQNNFGGDGVNTFNLPDMRGRFLRGTSHGTSRDPDAAKRHSLMGGGNSGDAVGSAQNCATGNGVVPFTIAQAGDHSHAQTLVPSEDHHAAYGASGPAAYNTMAWTDAWTNTTSDGAHIHTMVGGDKETRPANIYLDWMIAQAAENDAPPVGSVTGFGGDVTLLSNMLELNTMGWLPCIGQKLKKSDPAYQALYAVIGGAFGEDNLNFTLPDLRGYFVSGAGPNAKPGSILAACRTGSPVNPFQTTSVGTHTHQVNGIPTDTHTIDVVAGWDLAENNTSPTASTVAGQHSHALTAGGDAESRPVNVYADFIIRFK